MAYDTMVAVWALVTVLTALATGLACVWRAVELRDARLLHVLYLAVAAVCAGLAGWVFASTLLM